MKTNGHYNPFCLESCFILLQQYHEKALSPNPDTIPNKPSGQAEQYPPSLPETVEERVHLRFPGHLAGLPFGNNNNNNNANSRCSFSPIKKSQLDGLYLDLFKTKSVCKIY